jgi:hypothetical protein
MFLPSISIFYWHLGERDGGFDNLLIYLKNKTFQTFPINLLIGFSALLRCVLREIPKETRIDIGFFKCSIVETLVGHPLLDIRGPMSSISIFTNDPYSIVEQMLSDMLNFLRILVISIIIWLENLQLLASLLYSTPYLFGLDIVQLISSRIDAWMGSTLVCYSHRHGEKYYLNKSKSLKKRPYHVACVIDSIHGSSEEFIRKLLRLFETLEVKQTSIYNMRGI